MSLDIIKKIKSQSWYKKYKRSTFYHLTRRPKLTFLSLLNRKGFMLNDKQRIWLEALALLGNRQDIVALETGRARNPHWAHSDGNSTFFLPKQKQIKQLISIDDDSENFSGYSSTYDFCTAFLTKEQKDKITFINGDSVTEISRLAPGTVLDFVLLDSANDPELIYNEFMKVRPFFSKSGTVVVIDDVEGAGIKGNKIIPYLIEQGYEERRSHCPPCGSSVFFIKE